MTMGGLTALLLVALVRSPFCILALKLGNDQEARERRERELRSPQIAWRVWKCQLEYEARIGRPAGATGPPTPPAHRCYASARNSAGA
jgi:hypothetical protein